MCLAADAVMNFSFQKPYGALDAPNFESDLLIPVIDFSRMQQWPFYFPWMFGTVFGLTAKLPEWVIKKYLQGLLTQQNAMRVSDLQLTSTSNQTDLLLGLSRCATTKLAT